MSESKTNLADSAATLNEVNEKTAEKTFKSMTWAERWLYTKEIITIEPLLVCYLVGALMCIPALTRLQLEKACLVDLGYNKTICDAMLTGENGEDFIKEQEESQIYKNQITSWFISIPNIIPIILTLFLGSYSDRHQIRKPCLLLPLVGELFSITGIILSAIFLEEWSLITLSVFQVVIPSFFGGLTLLILAVFSYIADVSTLEQRTVRIGILQILLNVSAPLVQTFSADLYSVLGYVGIFMITAFFLLMGLLYGIFFVKEPRKPIETSPKKNLIVDIFDPKQAIETFALLWKKKPGNKLKYIIFIMIILFLTTGAANGEATQYYNYFNLVFKWTEIEYTYLLAFSSWIHLAGAVIGLPLFTKILKLSDFAIIIISYFDHMISNTILGLAKASTMLFVGISVGMVSGIGIIGLRSLSTKVVSADDLGKAQSLFAICQSLGASAIVPFYNEVIYRNTIQTNPNAFFFVMIPIVAICSLLIIYMYFNSRHEFQSEDEKTDKNEVQNGIDNNGMTMNENVTTHI